MNFLLLILATAFGFMPAAVSEPKFRYVDTENKDKPKDETANTPPPKPAYYDNYKKSIANAKKQEAQQTPPASPSKMSDEDMQKLTEAITKAQEEAKKPPTKK